MAKRNPVKVNTRSVASHYAGPRERIIEVSGSRNGCLIAVRETDDGRLLVDVYRADQGVTVRGPAAPPAAFRVLLASCGNPDLDQDPERPLPGASARTAESDDLAGISRACREYIEQHGLGAGNWSGGEVRAANGTLVGRVSYNGKVWSATGTAGVDAAILFCPSWGRPPVPAK
jgi:hypothetical protein